MDPYNNVFAGKEGTGAAFVLNGNKAADIFNNGVEQNIQRQRMAEFQRQKALADQEAASSQFLSELKVGEHWQNDDKELQDYFKKIWDDSVKIKMEGGNPGNDPKILSAKREVNNMAAYSKASGEHFDEFFKTYSTDPDKIENANEMIGWWKRPLAERMKEGSIPPTPIIKYTTADAVKEFGGSVPYKVDNDGSYRTKTPDITKAITQAEQSTATKAAKYRIKKLGGVIDEGYVEGFPIVSTDENGNITEKKWNTSGKELEMSVLHRLQEDPEGFEAILKREGYDISTPDNVMKSGFEFAAKQNKAAGSYIDEYKNTLLGRSDSEKTKVYTAAYNARAIKKAESTKAKEKEPDKSATYRQDWINDLFDGVEGSGEKLKAALKGNPDYKGELVIGLINSQPSKIYFKIPPKVILSEDENGLVKSKTIPGHTITIDKNDPNDKITLNQLISDITKEKVNMSQLMTEGGKKNVPDGKGASEIKKPSKDPLNLF